MIGTQKPYRKGEVPSKIQDILIGCLLGDASGELGAKGKTPCFAFKQGMVHANYLYFLYFVFSNWGFTAQGTSVPIPFSTKDNKGNLHLALRFRTLAAPNLSYLYDMFYNNKKKIVPRNIAEILNARALAYWIMDDGSWAGSGVLLHTNNFVLSDVELLAKTLKEKFNLQLTIRVKGNNHIIYIRAESIKHLISLVKPYIRPEFFYKLGI